LKFCFELFQNGRRNHHGNSRAGQASRLAAREVRKNIEVIVRLTPTEFPDQPELCDGEITFGVSDPFEDGVDFFSHQRVHHHEALFLLIITEIERLFNGNVTFYLTVIPPFTIVYRGPDSRENCRALWSGNAMKIKVERNKIVKAVKKTEGIELVLNDAADAREALDFILRRTELFEGDHYEKLKDLTVTAVQEYKTSAVDYTVQFVLKFIFEAGTALDEKAAFIKDLQRFFDKI
jgi:hypothetical protein